MKIYFSNYKVGICLLFILLSSISMVYAAHGNVETNQTEFDQILKKQQPKSRFVKKLLNRKARQAASDDKSISNGAIITLIVGVLALFCLFAPLLAAFGTGIWILAIILALVGDIFGIRTLRKIKKSDDPAKYSDEKIMTIVGFTMALLTGIIPLLLLGIVLLSL